MLAALHDPCNSRALSDQLDHQDCPVDRGSLNPMFYQRVPEIKIEGQVKNCQNSSQLVQLAT